MALRNANASAARIGWPLHVEKPSGRPVDVMSEQTREPIPVTEPMLETMLAGQETTAATPETTARLAETAPIEPPGASAEVVPFRLKSADQPPAPLESMAIAAERPRMERGPRFSPREASPVARVAADEFAPEGAPIKELRDASTAYYRAKLQARTVTNPDLGGITFTGRGLREMRYASANPDKLRLVAALPDILTKGRLVSSEAESKGKEGVVAYHRIGAQVEVGTKPLYVEVVVEERNDGKIYYNHFLAKDEASLRTVRIPGDKPGTDRTGEAPVVSDGQDLSDPNDDSLNIVPNDPTRKPQFSPRVMGENRSRDYASEQRQAFDGGGRTAEPLVIAAESPRAEGPQLSPRIEAEPVARVSEDELVPRGSDIRTLRQAAIDYFRTKLQGRTVTNADLGAITFTGRGRREMRHVAANPDKLRIVPLLAEILSKGRLIKSEPNYKDKQDVEAYHTLRAIARIGDRLVYVDALVEQRINGKIYYTHFAENEEASLRVASSPGTKTGTSQSGEAPGVIKAKDPADDALNIVPNDPTRKPQFSPRIKPRDLEQARQAVGDVFAEMQRGQVSSRAVSLGDVTQWLTDQAKAAGLDVAGFRHSIDVSAIRHIWKRHTNAKIEQSRGQVPVTPEDLRRIPDVLVAPDYLLFGGKGGRGLDAIGYIKRLDDGSMLYFEERRSGRYELAALTFMKYPAGTRAAAIANNLGLYVRSDGGRLNIVRAGGRSSAIQLPGPNDQPSFSPRQYGIPADATAITTFKSDEGIKARRDYKAAKAGNPAAAARLVSGLVRPEQVETARAKFGSDALYVPVVAEEATGHNAIPAFLARYYAEVTAADVARGIRQTVRAFHTGADAMGRLIARPAFEGPVERGRNYVIVDDVSVLGGTLAELANHIQAGGGRIAGVITLVNASRSGQYSPRRGHVALIERRFGNEIREAFGVEPGALTADEVQYLVNFKDADALRARRINAQGERERRLREKGVLPSEAQAEVRERDVESDDKPRFSPRQDRRAPGFYSALTRAVENLKVGEMSPDQWRSTLQNLQGVKAAELKWVGLDDWLVERANRPGGAIRNREEPITKQEILDFLRAHEIQVMETEKGGGTPTRFKGGYRLSGGKGYRELLLLLPERSDDKPYNGIHWDVDNVLAHVRFDQRTGSHGERILHLAEVQSDWHQEGRRRGYRWRTIGEIDREWAAVKAELLRREPGLDMNNRSEFQSALSQSPELWSRLLELQKERSKLPPTPFEKAWAELTMKRVIGYAAEHGYDRVTWETGATIVERFQSRRKLGEIHYWADSDGGIHTAALDRKRSFILEPRVVEAPNRVTKLSRMFGRDLAERIAREEGAASDQYEGARVIPGDGRLVGGEDMFALYDDMLPNIVRKLGRRFGAEVADTWVENRNGRRIPVHGIDITPEMRRSVIEDGLPYLSPRQVADRPNRRAERNSFAAGQPPERSFNRGIRIVAGGPEPSDEPERDLADEQRHVRAMYLNALRRRSAQSLSVME